MSEYTIHMIGNAHIDPVWLWRWTEGLEVVKSTYRQAVEFMKEFPDFVFTAGQAITYKWVEESDPQLFEEIKHFVQEGRWNIVNGWWVQPDCNIPSGESFVRQSLYGKMYFKEKFGIDVKVGYNVDSFGHNGGLPQILKKSGFDFYVFMRPDPNEKKLESRLFWWEGQDGSKILTARLVHAYCEPGDRESLLRKIDDLYKQKFSEINDDFCFYGVGDHGGGPTREEIGAIKEFNKPGVRLIFSTLDAFFALILRQKSNFPVLRDDLQHHACGCYTVVAWQKKANRQSENLLTTAEKFRSIGYLMGLFSYPEKKIRELWQKVLFNQFHDVMGGTCIPEAYDDCKKDYDEIFKTGNEIVESSIKEITSKINTSGSGRAVIFFNPCVWQRKEIVNVDVEGKNFSVINPKGKTVPSQKLRLTDSKSRLIFPVDVPSLGYSTYHIIDQANKRKWPPLLRWRSLANLCGGRPANESRRSSLRVSPVSIENDLYFLQLNKHTGGLIHIYDKINKIDILASGREGNEMFVLEDSSDTWSHGVNSYEKVIGKFIIQGEPEIVESGPVRATLRLRSAFLNSTIEQEISLYNELPRIDFNTRVNWQEKHKMLKAGFPLGIESDKTTYEIPYGTIVRKNTGDEEPGQSWIDFSGIIKRRGKKINYGVSLINDCKYGYSVKENELRISLIRSPIYAFHDPQKPEPGVEYKYTDQGEHRFRYSLVLHKGNWQQAGIPRIACGFNNPLISSMEDNHPGEYPRELSFMKIEPLNLIGTVLKKAEKGEEIIIRFYETDGKGGTANISFPWFKSSFKASFRPYEIKTLCVDLDAKPPRVEECNLLEE